MVRRVITDTAVGLASFAVAALIVAWVSVFKRPPAMFVDGFYWTSAGHLAFVVLRIVPARMMFGSWVCCVVGMLLAVGAR